MICKQQHTHDNQHTCLKLKVCQVLCMYGEWNTIQGVETGAKKCPAHQDNN